jgi:dTDP-glucose 4,6-dehydratase
MRLLVTGAAGFIGSTFVRTVLDARPDDRVVGLDKLTYAGRRENLLDVEDRIDLSVGAIEDRVAVREAMEGCDAVVNFAAESHVDRSIADEEGFAITHVIGTTVLLETARARRRTLPPGLDRRGLWLDREAPPRPPATFWSPPTSTPTASTR